MPGSLTHVWYFQQYAPSLNPLGAILPDYLPFDKSFRWEQTHDIPLMEEYRGRVVREDPHYRWLAEGMLHHALADREVDSHHGLLKYLDGLNGDVEGILHKEVGELSGRQLTFLSDLLFDFIFDQQLLQREPQFPEEIHYAIKTTSLEAVAQHLARFFDAKPSRLHRNLRYLRRMDFSTLTTSPEEATRVYLKQRDWNPDGDLLKKILGKGFKAAYLMHIFHRHKAQIDQIKASATAYFTQIEPEISQRLKDIRLP